MSACTPTGLATTGSPAAMYCSTFSPHLPRLHGSSGTQATPTSAPAISAASVSSAHGTGSMAAAVTTRLCFHTFVIKLAIRHPVLVAKQTMSLAAISNNRFSLGVGISPWPEDFEITGVPWKGRGERMNEMMEILAGLMKGEFFSYQGKHFNFQSIKMTPAPTKPVPLLVGGHSDAALERAAKYDGWMHAGGDLEEMKKMIAKLKEILYN